MKRPPSRWILGCALTIASFAADTLGLHPDSTHCFVYQGKPVVLITAGEHYGAVVNADFQYVPYLDALARNHLNLTRVFPLVREVESSIQGLGYANTLAPRPGREVLPWKRTGPRYDLKQWNPDYFSRLKDFVNQAAHRNIVVEISLLTQVYSQKQWEAQPFFKDNNINGVGKTLTSYRQLLEPFEPATFEFQKAFVRKMAEELNAFDNLYFELANETTTRLPDPRPAERQVKWQLALAQVVRDTERTLPKRHLVAVNAHQKILAYRENGNDYVETGDNAFLDQQLVDIINYHYLGRKRVGRGLAAIDSGMPRTGNIWDFFRARTSVRKPIVYDENYSGVIAAAPPFWTRNRIEAWETIVSGGAGFDHLEWSFTTDDPLGSGKGAFPDGRHLDSREFRGQLGALADLWHASNPAEMSPHAGLVDSAPGPTRAFTSANRDHNHYVVYVADTREDDAGFGGNLTGTLKLRLPSGAYELRLLCSGAVEWSMPVRVIAAGGVADVRLPEFRHDCAVDLTLYRPASARMR